VLTLAEARRIALRAQGLADDETPFGAGKPGVLRALQHLGYVQVDTISVVQRAHHHVLWSRVPDYAPQMLHELQEPDRRVFEYWNHAASYLPMADFRFSLPRMRRARKEMHWSDESPELKTAMRRVVKLIRSNGPLQLRDFESSTKVEGWATFSKIERRALHELWMRGQVMIRSRQGFQKVFDLPERILPPEIDQTLPSTRETAEFHIRRALRALGIARLSELHYLQGSETASQIRAALKPLLHRGDVCEVRVAEYPEVPCFGLPESLKLSAPLDRTRLHFLSPFDNLVIQRERLRWLFDFHYVIECYVPAPKRRFGYFCLPILWGDRCIGRMDAKADRPSRTLLLQSLRFEEGFADFEKLRPAWFETMRRFLAFQGCDRLKILKAAPTSATRILKFPE
jgi:uncharacterized protein YcaQ